MEGMMIFSFFVLFDFCFYFIVLKKKKI